MSDTAAGRHQDGGREFTGPFGLLVGLTMAYGRRRVTRAVADLAEVGPGDRVLDVGCGPGRFMRVAAARGAEVTGVEPSPQMRQLALRLMPARLRPAVTVVDGTAERMPLDDGSATVAWAVASVHHWTDVAAGLAELHRVLAPGGRLLLVERLARPRGWLQKHAMSQETADVVAEQTTAAGFTEVAVERHRAGASRLMVVRGRRG